MPDAVYLSHFTSGLTYYLTSVSLSAKSDKASSSSSSKVSEVEVPALALSLAFRVLGCSRISATLHKTQNVTKRGVSGGCSPPVPVRYSFSQPRNNGSGDVLLFVPMHLEPPFPSTRKSHGIIELDAAHFRNPAGLSPGEVRNLHVRQGKRESICRKIRRFLL